MSDYILRQPVQAVRYELNGNENEVMDLIRSTGRDGMSMDNMRGNLHVYNNGPELRIEDGNWVVAVGDDVAVIGDEQFARLFDPA